MKKIMIIAGEPSGDAHAAKLVDSLQKEDCQFYGMGGNKMQASGVMLLEHINKISVMGIIEVITKLPVLYKTLFKLRHSLKHSPPDLLILVDFQAFNLKLAKIAKRLGIKTLFYIGPQVWAWRAYRIKKIKKVINYMAVIFPFEVDFYQKYGMQVSFVGHPLLEKIKPVNTADFFKQYPLDPNKKIISLLPGSRHSEIIKHLPIFTQIINQLADKNYQFLISRYQNNQQLAAYFNALPKSAIIVDDYFYTMLAVADFAVVASGTATLEAALLKTPMLMIVKVSGLSYLIYKKMLKTPFISMVNVILQKQAIIELVQQNATAKRICLDIDRVLSSQSTLDKMQADFKVLEQKLSIKPEQSLKHLILKLLYD